MKRRKFNLMVCGGGRQWYEVESTDYDLDIGLVRYKDTLYDIRTGLWAVRLNMIKGGNGVWYQIGCSKVEDLKMTEMLYYVKNNNLFVKALEKERQTQRVQELETKNIVESTLFSINEMV
jgi:hypothetical protein